MAYQQSCLCVHKFVASKIGQESVKEKCVKEKRVKEKRVKENWSPMYKKEERKRKNANFAKQRKAVKILIGENVIAKTE